MLHDVGALPEGFTISHVSRLGDGRVRFLVGYKALGISKYVAVPNDRNAQRAAVEEAITLIRARVEEINRTGDAHAA